MDIGMGKRGNMPGLLGFIDSPDIRVFNKDTVFTPIEQAVLVSRSRHRTLEEKIDALNYLLGHYTEGEFQEGAEKVGGYCKGTDGGLRSCILRTLNEWEQVLEDRYLEKGYVFAACLNEKDYRQDGVSDYCYFSSYGKAYGYLTGMKKEYLTDGRLRQAKTFGIIHRFQLDGTFGERPSQDTYFFDHGMRLVDGVKAADGYLGTNLEGLSIYVPLPFEVGDIVKVENPFLEDYYGIVSHKRTPKMALAGMVTSIDTFDAGTKSFDYTDDTDILAMVNCPDEEIPENQKVLKALRDIRKGKMDFYNLLYCYGQGDLEGLVQRLYM